MVSGRKGGDKSRATDEGLHRLGKESVSVSHDFFVRERPLKWIEWLAARQYRIERKCRTVNNATNHQSVRRPSILQLRERTSDGGFPLLARLPATPELIRGGRLSKGKESGSFRDQEPCLVRDDHTTPPFSVITSPLGLRGAVTIAPARSVAARSGSSKRCE